MEKKSYEEIATQVSEIWNQTVDPHDLERIIDLQLNQQGVLASSNESQDPPSRQQPKLMFLSFRCLTPDHIKPLTNIAKFLFSKYVFLPILPLILLSRILFYGYNLPEYRLGLDLVSKPSYVILILLVLISILWHEIGHASGARYRGVDHGEIRFGLYLVFPVFYADVSESWRLPAQKRLAVDLGGAYFHLLASLVSHGLYLLTGSAEFLGLVILIDTMVLYTLNPIFHFDGYWVLTDLLGVFNLYQLRRKVVFRMLASRLGWQIPLYTSLKEGTWKMRILKGYSILTFIFFGIFFTGIFVFAIKTLPDAPQYITEAWKQVLDAQQSSDYGSIFKSLFGILFRAAFFLGMCFILFRLLRSVWMKTVSLIKEIRSEPTSRLAPMLQGLGQCIQEIPKILVEGLILSVPAAFITYLCHESGHILARLIFTGELPAFTWSIWPETVIVSSSMEKYVGLLLLLGGPLCITILAISGSWILDWKKSSGLKWRFVTYLHSFLWLMVAWAFLTTIWSGESNLGQMAMLLGLPVWLVSIFSLVILVIALLEITRGWCSMVGFHGQVKNSLGFSILILTATVVPVFMSAYCVAEKSIEAQNLPWVIAPLILFALTILSFFANQEAFYRNPAAGSKARKG